MKLLIGLFGLMLNSVVMADELLVNVAERMSCDDINARIIELTAVSEPDELVIDELTNLKAEYRRSCTKSARGRRNAAASRVVVNNSVPVVETFEVAEPQSEEDTVVNEDALSENIPADTDVVQENLQEEILVPEENDVTAEHIEAQQDTISEEELLKKELEQELANLDSGLCADGTPPNKYGCCADELFKDMGNMVFACCPKDGGDCFPPIN
ncbi:MAG: hypothetical protein IJN91_03995 [Alphaproteobacteria bacterium]|nr:hypothetical protein [Alphaproteobacteria bacterium]